MILLGLGTGVVAKWIWRIQLRWLGCGALLWAIAVEEKKFIYGFIAGLLNQPSLGAFQNHLPNTLHLVLGAIYIGLLTGITEPVVTLAAGLLWRQLAYDARRAVGIGLGAGAFEAVCLGLMAIVASREMVGSQAGFGISVLVPVVERLIVIPCHASVRAMTLYAVATGRWSWFWGGFAIFSAMDSIAGFYHLTNVTMNSWLIELCFLPFSVMSVLLVRYLWQHWPSQANIAPEPTLNLKAVPSCPPDFQELP
jgi:hypothetical protein